MLCILSIPYSSHNHETSFVAGIRLECGEQFIANAGTVDTALNHG